MREAAADLEFEEAARLRDEIKRLQDHELGLDKPGMPTGGAPGGAGGFAERIAHAGAASKSRKGKYARSRGKRRKETCRAPAAKPDPDQPPPHLGWIRRPPGCSGAEQTGR